ncbi:unnamed protein product [Blepharisma stoltei]|uniref:Uncharacterized protein n=1 Tax=Blepharisma stoltei TaxID=1481888 RepID=A0AAU9J037_9CILI|nr:unnamed protein product [Blepharisma stoltei]
METRSQRNTLHAWPPPNRSTLLSPTRVIPDMPRGSVRNLIEVYEKRIRDSSPQESIIPRRHTVDAPIRRFQQQLNDENYSPEENFEPIEEEYKHNEEVEKKLIESEYEIEEQGKIKETFEEVKMIAAIQVEKLPEKELLNDNDEQLYDSGSDSSPKKGEKEIIEEINIVIQPKKREEKPKQELLLETVHNIEFSPPFQSQIKFTPKQVSPSSFFSPKSYSKFSFSSPKSDLKAEGSEISVSARLKNISTAMQLSTVPDEIADVDVLCVNCYECIPTDQVDSHSLTCLKPSIEENDHSHIDIRVKKILGSISQRLIEATGDKLLTLMRLQELAHAILECSIDSCAILDRLDSIVASSATMSDGIPCLIFAKRLITLIEAKGPFSPPKDDLTGDQLLKAYEEEAEQQRRELERWKLRSELLLQLAGNSGGKEIDTVTSDLGSDLERNSQISFVTGVSEYNTDIGNIEDAEQVIQEISEEELEKYFYSICIKKKLELPRNHPAHGKPISNLYSQCKTQQIPISQWEEFVNNAYN